MNGVIIVNALDVWGLKYSIVKILSIQTPYKEKGLNMEVQYLDGDDETMLSIME